MSRPRLTLIVSNDPSCAEAGTDRGQGTWLVSLWGDIAGHCPSIGAGIGKDEGRLSADRNLCKVGARQACYKSKRPLAAVRDGVRITHQKPALRTFVHDAAFEHGWMTAKRDFPNFCLHGFCSRSILSRLQSAFCRDAAKITRAAIEPRWCSPNPSCSLNAFWLNRRGGAFRSSSEGPLHCTGKPFTGSRT